MDSILPERLLALVRPAFDLVLRRIRSPKRCVQACGCKIITPKYACKMPSSCVSARRAKKNMESQTCWAFCQTACLGGIILQPTPARSVLDFEPFAGQGQMLDGRVPGASQLKKPSKERGAVCSRFRAAQAAAVAAVAAQFA